MNLESQRWFKYWRQSAAFIYLFICLFDFFIMPSIAAVRQREFNESVFEKVQDMTPEIQQVVLNKINFVNHWQPLTLQGGGLFHASFGFILGISAYTRPKEKIAIKHEDPKEPNKHEPYNGESLD